MNKICVYAICKNEIQHINNWLEGVKEADYVVVLDTGSTDGSYEYLCNDDRVTLCKQKEIIPWRFDEARNESMKLIPDDANILLSVDIDEYFNPGWAKILREQWIEGVHTKAQFPFSYARTPDDKPTDFMMYDKTHTRKYYWKYNIHEILVCDELIPEEEILIIKDGILLEHHKLEEVKSRNDWKLLMERDRDYSNDPLSKYLLAREFGYYENYQTSLAIFLEVEKMENFSKYPILAGSTYGLIGDIYRCLGDNMKAMEYYLKWINLDKTYREPYLCLAEIYNEAGLYSTAYGIVQDALKNTYQHMDWAERGVAWREQAWDALSVSCFELGKYKEGYEYVLKAYEYCPNNERIIENLKAFKEKL